MSGQTTSRPTGLGGRWTTLDRIVEIEPGRKATAVRNVTNTVSIFDSHFPRFPVLPGVLILGSMGELASLLLVQDGPGGWRLAGADRVGFRHFVSPGDELELTVELQKRDETEATLSAEAKVDGKVVTRARRLRLVRTSDE